MYVCVHIYIHIKYIEIHLYTYIYGTLPQRPTFYMKIMCALHLLLTEHNCTSFWNLYAPKLEKKHFPTLASLIISHWPTQFHVFGEPNSSGFQISKFPDSVGLTFQISNSTVAFCFGNTSNARGNCNLHGNSNIKCNRNNDSNKNNKNNSGSSSSSIISIINSSSKKSNKNNGNSNNNNN